MTEFRFDDDGSLIDLEATGRPASDAEVDLRSEKSAEAIEHLIRLGSGEVITVVGANAYQPEGPMTTFFSTGSSRGTIDSWSVRIASYRTNDIVSIQRHLASPSDQRRRRPSLIAV